MEEGGKCREKKKQSSVIYNPEKLYEKIGSIYQNIYVYFILKFGGKLKAASVLQRKEIYQT